MQQPTIVYTTCLACGQNLIKQPLGQDGMPNPQQPEPPANLPRWQEEAWIRINKKTFPEIWSCPTHGTVPYREAEAAKRLQQANNSNVVV